jgi:hypothetical protein
MNDLRSLPGLKEAELVKLGNCAACGNPLLAHAGVPFFFKLTMSRAGFDPNAIRRRVGLEMQMGSAALAQVMGPNEDIAKVIDGPVDVVVHESCASDIPHLLTLFPKQD